jgi:hypothetical protein
MSRTSCSAGGFGFNAGTFDTGAEDFWLVFTPRRLRCVRDPPLLKQPKLAHEP